VMQERQVTIEGAPQAVPQPFMVLATQNPIEHEGTYPLPEAELDRFLMKIFIDYPTLADEIHITKTITTDHVDDREALAPATALIDAAAIVQLQQVAASVTVDDHVVDYAVRLVRATRDHSALLRGAGTRACIALVRCARAHALLRGENFVLPDDIKAMALPVMRHRVALGADVEIDGLSADDVLARVFETVQAPRL
jgi:MoxR-like ATPase